MIFLISSKDCCINIDNCVEIKSGARYELSTIENKYLEVIDRASGRVFAINFYDVIFNKHKNQYIKTFRIKNDIYCFLNLCTCEYNLSINVFESILSIQISNEISIDYNNDKKIVRFTSYIKFSHIEYFGKIIAIFFEGDRSFVIILNKETLLYCDYYDEINLQEKEMSLLTKLHDSVNHGRVVKIEKEKIETFLVYLDDYEMCLRSELCVEVFLDCVIAGNFKYVQNLLDESLVDKIEDLKSFFDGITSFYPINKTQCVCIKKDATVDIFQFEFQNNKIMNIIVV